ncbi:MAG: hypothetical protein VXW58_08200, partial [Pseudomonadota bacterium]|nr:hypothetical protein [Pseudomonadota bacterium]
MTILRVFFARLAALLLVSNGGAPIRLTVHQASAIRGGAPAPDPERHIDTGDDGDEGNENNEDDEGDEGDESNEGN